MDVWTVVSYCWYYKVYYVWCHWRPPLLKILWSVNFTFKGSEMHVGWKPLTGGIQNVILFSHLEQSLWLLKHINAAAVEVEVHPARSWSSSTLTDSTHTHTHTSCEMAALRSALAVIVLVLAVVAVTEGRFAGIIINECVRGTYAVMWTTNWNNCKSWTEIWPNNVKFSPLQNTCSQLSFDL